MRIETNLSAIPPAFTVEKENDKAIITFYTDVQEEASVGENQSPSYKAIAWTVTRSWTSGLYSRIESHTDKWLEMAQNECYEKAAAEVRTVRDTLLKESDQEMLLDRMGLEVPTGTTFTAWLTFLKTLGSAICNDMAVYRQALRDISTQDGFPYNVQWPSKPE